MSLRGADAEQPGSGVVPPPPVQAGRRPRPRVREPILAAVAVLAVFFVHFRPWQGGLLEDWGLALAWNAEGLGGFAARVPLTMGRPLHLLPHYLGMAVSNGGFVGPYAVLGAVAVAQLAVALWAIAPLTEYRLLRWATALAIALHPWWVAGDILRFLPGQVAVLGVVIWLGASLRFLATGRRRWVWLIVLGPLAGLLTYQAPAAALVLGSAILALATSTSWRRRAALVGLTTGVSAVVMIWSMVLAPILSPASYESQLGAPAVHLVASLHAILRTVVLHAPATALATLIVGLTVIALGFSRSLDQGRAWLFLAGVALVPLSAVVYASEGAHLNDPERVALPIGVMLWIVFCCLLPALSTHRSLRVVTTAVLLAGTTAGAVFGYVIWTSYAASQQVLIEAVQSVRRNVPHDRQLVVADQSGRFGDVYLLLPPHLDFALDVEHGAGADAILCTPAGVARIQPTAALFPISTTPDCGTLLKGKVAISLGDLVTTQGTFKVYELDHAG